MFDRWAVKGFFADVRERESFTKVEWPKLYADQLVTLAVPGGKDPQPIAWDMRVHTYDFTMACELTLTEIQEHGFTHDGDSRVARHVVNARRHPNRWGVSISKETRDSAKKIDAAVCVVGARMVRRLYLASAVREKKPRSGKVHGFA
jgi:phage terminase large subunit-like protein